MSEEIPFQEQSHWREKDPEEPVKKPPLTKRFTVPDAAAMASAWLALASIGVSAVIRFEFLDLLAVLIALPAFVLIFLKGKPFQMNATLNYYMANHTITLRAWLRSRESLGEFIGEERRLVMIGMLAGSIVSLPLGFLYHPLVSLAVALSVSVILLAAALLFSGRDMAAFASALNGAGVVLMLHVAGTSLFKDYHAAGLFWLGCLLILIAKKTKNLVITDIETAK